MAPLPEVEDAESLCWPTDWCQEELPEEDKRGQALDLCVDRIVQEANVVPPPFENFGKFDECPRARAEFPEAPQRESVLVFSDNLDFCKGILDAAPEGRVGTKKIVEDCAALQQPDMKKILGSQKNGWDLVIFGFGMDPPASNSVQSLIAQQDLCAKLYLWLLQELQDSDARLAVLTRGVFSEDADQHKRFGLQMLTGAALFGMSNSARLELDIRIQYIDVDWQLQGATGTLDPHKLLPRAAAEVFRHQTFGQNSVRLVSSGRFVLRRVPSRQYEAVRREFELPSSGTIAISGVSANEYGDVGLVMARDLLDRAEDQRTGGFSLVLLHRPGSEVANKGLWEEIQKQALRLGIPVELRKCDVSSMKAVDEFVQGQQGKLTGFIHAASVVKDSMLSNLDWGMFDEVFDSRHRAALLIHSALEKHKNPNFKFFWLFSAGSVFGQLGQINASGTSSCLDALARYRVGRGRPCTSVQWGILGEVGLAVTMPEAMRRRIDAGPEPFISVPEALRGLEAGLQTGLPVFAVLKFNRAVLREAMRGADTALQCYSRNFQSEVLQLPTLTQFQPHQVYTVFREAQGSYLERQRLCYNAYTKVFLEEDEQEWGDDFRKWAK